VNEQNNNINPNPQPLNNGQQPVQPIQPSPQNFGAPVNAVPIQGQAPVTPNVTPTQPVQPINPTPNVVEPQPQSMPTTQTVNPTPNVIEQQPQQPIQTQATITPTPNVVVDQQPVQVSPQQVQNIQPQGVPIQNEQPIVQQQPIQQNVPISEPINQNIQNMNQTQNIVPQQQPITPQQNISTPVNGVFAPSVPIGGASDVTNVGFVAASSEMPKKKKPLLIIGIVVIILAILAIVGYFVIYPYIMKTYFSDPKNVYETSIKEAFKGLNTTVDDLVHNKGIYNLEVSLDSNIETLEEYVGYTYGLNIGIDPTKKALQQGIYIKDNKTKAEHSYYSYLKDKKYYDKYSSYRDYIYLGETAGNSILSIFNQEDLFNTSSNLNNEEINYIVNKISDLLIESINQDKLSKEDASISINGETLKVTNNKYELDYNTIKETIEFVRDGLINDDKAIEILSKVSNVEKSKIKDELNSIKVPENEEKDFKIIISIYTHGNKNEIIGFAINDKDEHLDFYYYFKNNIIDSKLTISYKDEYNKNETIVIKMSATKDSTTHVQINYDNEDINDSNKGKELLTLDIRTWDESGIDLDYNATIKDGKYNGTLKFVNDVNSNRAKYAFDFSVKNGNEYIELNISFSDDWTSEVANINTTAAVTLTDEELLNHHNEFINNLKNTPIGKLLTTVSNDYDPSIKNYYTQNNLNNNEENTIINEN